MKRYWFLKTIFAGIYIGTFVLTIKLFLMPLINLYGGWTFLGYWLGITIVGLISSYAYFWLPVPRQPQATPRTHQYDISLHPNVETLREAIDRDIKENITS